MQNEGVMKGLATTVENKASGVIGLTKEWAMGVDSFGNEIRDPNAPAFKQLQQTLAATLKGLEPIGGAVDIARIGINKAFGTNLELTNPGMSGSDRALSVAGFTPAPKYISQSRTQGAISEVYKKYYAPNETSFDRAQYSGDARKLKQARESGDMDAYDNLLDKMKDKYELTGTELQKLRANSRSKIDPSVRMFGSFTWQQQKNLLDHMSEDERKQYLPHSNKQHLRGRYQPPDEGDE
jgi:hypothetical protein